MSERQLYHFCTGDQVVAVDPKEEYCPISEGIWTVIKVTRVFDVCDCGLGHPLNGRHQQGCSSLLGERSTSRHPQYILVKQKDSSEDIQKEISGWWAQPTKGQEVRLLEPLSTFGSPIVEPFQIFENGRKVFLRETGDIPKPSEVVSTLRVADICTCNLKDSHDTGKPHTGECGMRLGMFFYGHPQYVVVIQNEGDIITDGQILPGDLLIYADSPNPLAKK